MVLEEDTQKDNEKQVSSFDNNNRIDRLISKLFDIQKGTMCDEELLELILFFSKKRKGIFELSKILMEQCGSFPEVILAPTMKLRRIKGVTENVITIFRIVEEVSYKLVRHKIKNRIILGNSDELISYLKTTMGGMKIEQVKILFLNSKLELLDDRIQNIGTVDEVKIYIREIMFNALELSATGMILCHNHPSGDVQPSFEDIKCTRDIVEVSNYLGIKVYDHIIIGQNNFFSFKEHSLI